MANARSDELVDEIDVIRERLAVTVDALVDRSNPKNIARRGLENLKGRFIDETGSPRMETIVPVVGGAIAVIAGIVVIRRLLR
ncbi:DUF3618 domain-containing protein [Aeromicrobium chenweiae]|uniref:DUF3618 domain-containing protein n=1 Tax=Aeromicrobium chenweiae TaxID=2079793 RepID=A0A2S0WJU7_9ACTN|nr:DUF3618 domain-containing protein [Aeromicrobium chenweiae]AWB91615.1 DUF3618 domain-containing protein [Aeromicrobium chenweiae]TGN32453.1 DUF3618 domain-containing protein [Aeromicrobium chenweiae]